MQGKQTILEVFKCEESVAVWWRAKKAINGGSNGLHGCVFEIRAVSLPCGGVKTFKAFI